VSVLELLQAMLAIVLKRPDEARARPRNYIKDDKLYKLVFGPEVFTLSVYLKSTMLQRRIDDFLDEISLEGAPLGYSHRRNLKFNLGMYVACAATRNPHAPPDEILRLDPSAIKDDLIVDCYEHVLNHYVKLTEDEFPDSVAKGNVLLKRLSTELKRRFAIRKPRHTRKGVANGQNA
jgi:hypothetical protein